MNILSNIWKHPKTSIAGVLISIVTISGVLSQAGITLGTAGTGTIVALVCALATAFLGLLSKDPGAVTPSTPISSTTAKLGVSMLIALLLPLPFLAGCSGVTVAQDIVNWTPALQGAVATIDTTASLLAPLDAPIFTAATVGFDAASNVLVSQAKAYLLNPSASILAQLQTQVVTFQQSVNAALLQAAKITNPASQQHALASIQGVGAIVSAILALVQSISSKAAVAQMASMSTIKLASIEPLLDRNRAARIIADHYGESILSARVQVAQTERTQLAYGF